MRDCGFDFYWNDPYAENVFARGFEFNASQKSEVEVVTAFECFEHFTDPIREMERMLSISQSVLFSTVPFVSGTPNPDTWEYYSFSHGQHISFYSLKTLRYIADKFKMHFYTNGKSFHFITPAIVSHRIFNIVLWLSVIGIPSIATSWMGSKTKQDVFIAEKDRYRT